MTPGLGGATRLHVAFGVLQRQGHDPTSYADGAILLECDLREATIYAASTVRSAERLAAEHGAIDGSYEMKASKGEVVVILQAGRHRQCNVCHAWNSNKQRWCGGCRKRTYCGSHCEKTDWPAHKSNCIRALSEATAASSPAMEETIQAETMPEIRDVGNDDGGWAIIDAVWRSPGVKVVKVSVKGKPLARVLEDSVPLRVYVNPVLTEVDEWEKPPGSGHRLLVGTPPEELERHGIRMNRRHRRSRKACR